MEKKSLILMSVLALAVSLNTGCGNKTDSKEVAEDANEQKMENSKDEKDAEFVVNAYNANLFEVKAGELAKAKATMADCKQLADMMITAHTKANEELSSLAATKNITLPAGLSSADQDDLNDLDKQTNMDFDKKYCKLMVDKHEDAVKMFENASTDSKDQEIKDWAAKMLPDLRSHLEMSKSAKDKTDNANDGNGDNHHNDKDTTRM